MASRSKVEQHLYYMNTESYSPPKPASWLLVEGRLGRMSLPDHLILPVSLKHPVTPPKTSHPSNIPYSVGAKAHVPWLLFMISPMTTTPTKSSAVLNIPVTYQPSQEEK